MEISRRCAKRTRKQMPPLCGRADIHRPLPESKSLALDLTCIRLVCGLDVGLIATRGRRGGRRHGRADRRQLADRVPAAASAATTRRRGGCVSTTAIEYVLLRFLCPTHIFFRCSLRAGHVIDLHASRSTAAEQARDGEIRNLQAELRSRLGPVPVGLHGGDYNPTALSS